MNDVPFAPQRAYFPAEEGAPPRIVVTELIDGDRKTCRWCLEPFDAGKQQRSTSERGYLRTNLAMADNGTELVCCDDCWQGAIGARIVIHGVVVPCGDPHDVPNPLLKAFG